MGLHILFRMNAYLDPGTGSLLIQLLLAGLLGIGVAIRIFWKKIKGIFVKNKPVLDDENDPTAIDEDITE